MSDFFFDPVTNDIVFEGDIKMVEGLEEIAQAVRVAFRTHLGEWAFDTSFGLDYRGRVFVMNPDLGLIAAELRRVGASVPGVKRVKEIELTVDSKTRKLSGRANVETVVGDTVVGF